MTINSDGAFEFPTRYRSGAPYSVTVTDAPLNQNCSVTSGTGVLLSNVDTVFVQCQNTGVIIDNIQRLYLSSQGGAHNTSSIDWTPQYTENFEIRIGADCATGNLGTFTNNSGTTTTGVQETSVINQTDLVPGTNSIHICILDGSSNLIDFNTFTIERDDVSPVVTLGTASGSYNSPQSLSASCSDPASGCNALVYTIADVALPGTANPADPAVTTDGTPTTGTLYAAPLNAADLRNTQLELIGIDRAGNRSAVVIGNYTIDATVPALSLGAPSRDFISNAAGAPYDSSTISWTSNRSNMDYFVWYGATDCHGSGGTSITTGTTTGAGDTISVSAASIPVGAQTITIAERNFAGDYGCQTFTLTRDDTAPTVVAGGTPIGSTLAYDDEIDIRLSEQILPGSITVGGGDLDGEAVLPPTIVTTSNTDDTIQISPTTYWSPGSGRTIDVDVRDRAGNLLNLSLAFDLPNGTVEPMYAAAPDWNQHIRNDGTRVFDASGVSCDGTETGFITSCLHGGELRKVLVLNATSCAGLTASDANGWYGWGCYDPPGPGPVEMVTVVRVNGLREFIDFGTQTWNTNSVSVSNGFSTPTTAWWGNPIQTVPAGGISMNTANTVYVTTANVTMTGAITASVDNVTFSTAPSTAITTNVAAHQINITGRNFVWVEAGMRHIDGTGNSSGIFIRDSAFITVDRTAMANYRGFSNTGQVRVIHSRGLLFRNMVIANNPDHHGISFYSDTADSHHNWIDQVRIFNNTGHGIFYRGNSPNVVRDMLVTRSMIHNNGGGGIYASQGIANSLFMNSLSANNVGPGVNLLGTGPSGASNTLVNIVSINNQNGGITPGDNSQFINLGLSDNGGADVMAPLATGNFYSGVLYSGRASVLPDDQDGRCNAAGAGSGMQNDDDCTPEGPSDHTVISAFDLADQFRGPNGGVVAYAITNNWFALPNDYSGFGRSPTVPPAYPANGYRGNCDGTVLTGCREFDWQLVNTAPSPGFRNALACPDTLPTMPVTHTFSSGTYTFLRNAYALETDADWDLPMCMGDEQCLYTPNLGVYQGHAGLTDSGCTDLVGDPTFGNIDFQEFGTNGVP
ncbi:MAG: hypothetical protein CMN76_12160 [Spirochaetaceae bacterium]|nr:hypothetical protein [Spirochaetaceae bacterium]